MEDKNFKEVLVDGGGEGKRVDHYLAMHGVSFSRSHIQKLIKEDRVTVNGEACKASHRLFKGDKITVMIPPPKKLDIVAEDLPLDIVYEDKDLVVINKPPGMMVHPASGINSGTLVNALLSHFKHLSEIGGVERPGIVHRLDKNTSGLMVVAKNDKAHLALSKMLNERTVGKKYVALVHGVVPKDQGTIESRIGRNPSERKKMAVIRSDRIRSKEAITHYKVIDRFKNYTLLELKLVTGRTHQIRVHLASIGHPVVGDSVYGRASNEFKIKRQLLHAQSLAFKHPGTGKKMEFKSKLPEDFMEVVEKLGRVEKPSKGGQAGLK